MKEFNADRDILGRFKKGISPPTAFKKGNIPWNKGLTTHQVKKRCLTCNKEFLALNSNIKLGWGKYCSLECRPAWNKGLGNGHKTSSGYIMIKKENHPKCNKKGWVRKHKIVLEKHLGRYLKDSESIHHINKIKTDNRLKNLMLFSSHSTHLRYERGGKYKMKEIIFNGATLLLMLFLITPKAFAAKIGEHTEDNYCDAIWIAEGKDKAQYLYGIRSIPYIDEADARQICKNTVYNTLIKYRSDRCLTGESDIDCLSRRYCPVGADNDPHNLNRHWKKNVLLSLK